MDVSSVGVANSAQYLQRAQTGLQGPLTAVKQEEQVAQGYAMVNLSEPLHQFVSLPQRPSLELA